jgi:hypothetical protein
VALQVAQDGGNVIVTWPAPSCLVLQQTADLLNPVWVNNGNPVNVVNGNEQVIVPINGNQLFFRLTHP